jgi:hypothetical protein
MKVHGDCVKMFDDFTPHFGEKRKLAVASHQRTALHFPFSPGNFWPKTT